MKQSNKSPGKGKNKKKKKKKREQQCLYRNAYSLGNKEEIDLLYVDAEL